MTKEEKQLLIDDFKKRHGFDDKDMKNLKRYEDTRRGGSMNMLIYLGQMSGMNVNGGTRLADWIMAYSGEQYKEFLDLLEEIGY